MSQKLIFFSFLHRLSPLIIVILCCLLILEKRPDRTAGSLCANVKNAGRNGMSVTARGNVSRPKGQIKIIFGCVFVGVRV